MHNRKRQLEEFFNHYCSVFNGGLKNESASMEESAQLYSSSFIGANPLGVQCGSNDQQLHDSILRGYEFYRKIGITSMEIASTEITILDNVHSMTRVRWNSLYYKSDKSTGRIEFENIYLTQSLDDQHKVFAWITGDEQAALQEHGLIDNASTQGMNQ